MNSMGEWREYSRLVISELERMNKEQTEMNEKIDTLIAFKWQIIGGALAGSTIITLVVQLVFYVLDKGTR